MDVLLFDLMLIICGYFFICDYSFLILSNGLVCDCCFDLANLFGSRN